MLPVDLEAACPTLARRATCPRFVRERCSSPTSATDSLQSCTCSNRTLPEVMPRSREPPRLSGQAPTGDSGRRALDGALRALETPASRSTGRSPLSREVSWCRGRCPILMGDPIEVPSGCAPRRAAFSSARQESWCSADAPWGEPTSHRNAKLTHLARPSSMSRQRHRIPPRQGAFHRRMPARRRAFTRNLERGPATGRRLCRRGPASDALSPHRPVRGWRLDQLAFRRFITRARLRPCAVRRLLPSLRSASTVVGPSTPTFGRWTRLSPCPPSRSWSAVAPRAPPRERGSSRTAESSLPGSGALGWQQARARYLGTLASRWLAAEASPQPVRNSDTSCRARRALHG